MSLILYSKLNSGKGVIILKPITPSRYLKVILGKIYFKMHICITENTINNIRICITYETNVYKAAKNLRSNWRSQCVRNISTVHEIYLICVNKQFYSTHFLQVYEVLLHYSGHDDHNVVTATLETLQQLLKAPPPLLVHMLTTPGSIVASSVFAKDIAARPTPCGTSGQ